MFYQTKNAHFDSEIFLRFQQNSVILEIGIVIRFSCSESSTYCASCNCHCSTFSNDNTAQLVNKTVRYTSLRK